MITKEELLEQDHRHTWQYEVSDNRSGWRKDEFVCEDCKKHLTQKFAINWVGIVPTAVYELVREDIE